MNRIQQIQHRLGTHLSPIQLSIEDESHHHAGHRGHGGAGHFKVMIVSAAFEGKSLIARHRMVYQAVNDIMNTEIHALSIQAMTPAEFSKSN